MDRLRQERARRLERTSPKPKPALHPDCQIVQPPCGSEGKASLETICDGSEDGIAHGIVGQYWFCGRRSCSQCHKAFIAACLKHDETKDSAEALWERKCR